MSLSPSILALLALFGLAGGIGITAVGPGGVLPTIGLFLLTGLSPSEVAGTAIVTHIATGLLGTAMYVRSGQLNEPGTRRTALVLAGAAVVGTPVGALVNGAVSGRMFAILLATAVGVTGALVWLRERRARAEGESKTLGVPAAAALGFGVAVAAGMFGLGGPMLSVPLLVLCGVRVLDALAAAQVQSVVVASVGTVAYAVHGAVDWRLALIVGVPELLGVVLGWKIAKSVPPRRLKYALAVALLVIAPYLAVHG